VHTTQQPLALKSGPVHITLPPSAAPQPPPLTQIPSVHPSQQENADSQTPQAADNRQLLRSSPTRYSPTYRQGSSPSTHSITFASGSLKNTAGRPDADRVNSTPAASSFATSGCTLATPTQKWRSRPPWWGRAEGLLGSGLGSSIRWIISGPIQSHAPRYGRAWWGRSGLRSRPGGGVGLGWGWGVGMGLRVGDGDDVEPVGLNPDRDKHHQQAAAATKHGCATDARRRFPAHLARPGRTRVRSPGCSRSGPRGGRHAR